MDKMIRFLKNLLLGAFIIILCLAYYELADSTTAIKLYVDSNKKPLATTSADVFFYVPAIFMIVLNMLISTIVRVFKQIPIKNIKVINAEYWHADEERQEILQKILVSWIYGFALIINFFVVMLVTKTWFVNRGIGGQSWEYGVMGISFLLILGTWLFGIFYRLRLNREEFFVASEYVKDEDDK
jgi:hypothetical protein